jgi:hypothetical protein
MYETAKKQVVSHTFWQIIHRKWDRFVISVEGYGGVHSQLICTSSTLESLLPATRLANRNILIEQNIKKADRTSTLCTLCYFIWREVSAKVQLYSTIVQNNQRKAITIDAYIYIYMYIYTVYIYIHIYTCVTTTRERL